MQQADKSERTDSGQDGARERKCSGSEITIPTATIASDVTAGICLTKLALASGRPNECLDSAMH